MKKLTTKQQWFLDKLIRIKKFPAVGWVSPTFLGQCYFNETKKGSGHSSSASPVLLKLVEFGLIERNKKGHYKAL